MDAFQARENVVSNYREYLSSYLSIDDEQIKNEVTNSFECDGFIPKPLNTIEINF